MVVWVLRRALERQVLHYRQGLVREAGDPGRGAGPLARHDPQDEGRLPRRRHPDPVRGYEDLLEFDWEGYREKYGNIGRLDRQAGGDSTDRYKLAKQADDSDAAVLLSRDGT